MPHPTLPALTLAEDPSAVERSELRAFRLMLLLTSLAVPGFWLLDQVAGLVYDDPLAYRLGLSATGLLGLALTYVDARARRHVRKGMMAMVYVTASYLAWSAAKNGLDASWTAGLCLAALMAGLFLSLFARSAGGMVGTLLGLGVALVLPLALMTPPGGYVYPLGSFVGLLGFAGGSLYAAGAARLRMLDAVLVSQAALEAQRDTSAERERLLRTVIDALPDYIYVNDREGRAICRNRASAEMLGFDSPEDGLGTTVFDLFPHDVAAANWAKQRLVMETGQAIDDEHDLDVDGERRRFESTTVPLGEGRCLGVVGVLRDVTDHERAQRALRESDALRRSVLDAVPDVILTVDLDDRVLDVNPAVEWTLGYAPEALVGARFSDVAVPERYREEHRAKLRRFAESGHVGSLGRLLELPVLCGDGTAIPASVSIRPIPIGDGPPVFMIYVSDLSAQKAGEASLREALGTAEDATRAKSEFLATMSHEIRTPMNGVVGMTSLLLETPLDGDQREFVETIRTSGDALLTIINDILDFSKIEAGMLDLEEAPFDVAACVEDALDLVAQPAAEKGVELAYAIDPGVPRAVVGDVTRVRQVLVNLLSNAVKFTAAGSVCVRVEAAPTDAGTALTVAIADTGIGIAPDKLEAVFESFSQADASTTREYGGTGLGLAICRSLVGMMGGAMGVESVVGAGSTFRFTVPVGVDDAAEPGVARSPTLRDVRAVVALADPTVRVATVALLASWGVAAEGVASAADAIAAVAETGASLVVLDLQSPGLDGHDVAGVLRTLPSAPGVVGLTHEPRTAEVRGRAATAGVAVLLGKPARHRQLHDALVQALGGAMPAPAATAWVARPVSVPAAGPALRVLVAEDNLVNQKVATRLLARLGLRADVVANGVEAVEAVAHRSALGQPYDLVFMDVQMPEMDGLEATRRVRASAADQPRVVALTANAMEGDREACLAAGADEYLPKPVQLDAMRGAIARAEAARREVPLAA